MRFSSRLLFFCLLSVTLLQCSVHGVQQHRVQILDKPMLRSLAAFWHHPEGVKPGEELQVKLLQMNHLMRLENDVMERKKRRGFPGNNAPLDRLSLNSMETRQGRRKQSKMESPRRRDNPPPMDRIGISREPNGRGKPRP